MSEFLHKHPTVFKIVLIINHLFRITMMLGFMLLPIPLHVGMPICVMGSLFYRFTVEKKCAFKFALPSLAGALALMIAVPALISMMNGSATRLASTTAFACLGLIPLIAVSSYIVHQVHEDVEKEIKKQPSCCT